MADETKDEPSTRWFDDKAVQYERALLLLYGASCTVLAGFLSQVWSSAHLEFRSALAKHLSELGSIFLSLVVLPLIRIAAEAVREKSGKSEQGAWLLWFAWMMASFVTYNTIMIRLGDAIVYYAGL